MNKTINKSIPVERVTNGPKHHLFGFHDLVISNNKGDKYLSIETDVINRPPLPGELFGIGYVKDGEYIRIGNTTALNYPQGARLQWLGETNYFVVNNKIENKWGCDLYDSDTNQLVRRYEGTTHMITKDGKYALGLDYARLHRLGGYGYTGIADINENTPLPDNSGITIMNMQTGVVKVLVSVRQVAECGNKNLSNVSHHYLTHLCLNPSSNRIAFLHRYFMPDGGLMTRLMSIDLNGDNLRCLGQGFLSHYHWKDDKTIYIYGRMGSSIDTMRNSPFMQNPFIKHSIRFAKKCIKSIIGKNRDLIGGMSFLMVDDSDESLVTPFARDTIPFDGHPMTHPHDNNICVCDTYPNKDGDRDLFLYKFNQDIRVNIGRFKMIFDKPDLRLKHQFFLGIDKDILNTVSEDLIAFTRSGLHCDLHPRWSHDGEYVVFDSIHEGNRQIYRIPVSELLAAL